MSVLLNQASERPWRILVVVVLGAQVALIHTYEDFHPDLLGTEGENSSCCLIRWVCQKVATGRIFRRTPRTPARLDREQGCHGDVDPF